MSLCLNVSRNNDCLLYIHICAHIYITHIFITHIFITHIFLTQKSQWSSFLIFQYPHIKLLMFWFSLLTHSMFHLFLVFSAIIWTEADHLLPPRLLEKTFRLSVALAESCIFSGIYQHYIEYISLFTLLLDSYCIECIVIFQNNPVKSEKRSCQRPCPII